MNKHLTFLSFNYTTVTPSSETIACLLNNIQDAIWPFYEGSEAIQLNMKQSLLWNINIYCMARACKDEKKKRAEIGWLKE